MEWTGVLQRPRKDRLTFILGGLQNQYHPAPGYYSDIRVFWNRGSFLGSVEDVNNYFKVATVAPKGPKELPFKEYLLVDDKTITVGRNDGQRKYQEDIANDGAEEYAWSGWFRWD